MKYRDMEFVPKGFPQDYMMRAEYVREGIKAIIAIGLIAIVGYVLIWGLP
jgi:hypothetical protein